VWWLAVLLLADSSLSRPDAKALASQPETGTVARAAPAARPRGGHLAAWLRQPVASKAWDGLIRVSGALALAGILLVSFAPTLGELTVLVTLTLFVNGPYSMFLPTAHEPILMVFGRVYPPVLVAALATAGTVAAEYVDYRLYVALLSSAPGLRRLPDTPVARRLSVWFRAQPFLTVVLCALTPIPFWIARILASMTRYRMRRYLTAVALGRFPRQWFYAAVGIFLPLTNGQILLIGFAATLVLAVPIALRQRRSGAAAGAAGETVGPP